MNGFPLNKDQLIEAVKRIVPPRTVDSNLAAFDLSLSYGQIGFSMPF